MARALLLIPALLLCGCGEDSAPAQAPTAPISANLQWEQGAEFSGANAYLHCEALCKLGPRPSGSPAYAAQLQYLTAQLQKAGWQVTPRSFKLTNGVEMTNLHATYGNTTGTRSIIVTCHIDTKIGISPQFIGADDGASAAAAMLELARVLPGVSAAQAEAVELIFFDGEESFAPRMTERDGLYGSRYEVMRRAHHELPRYQINLDMVGGRNKRIAVPLPDTSEDMLEEYEKAIDALKLPERRWNLHPGSYFDDHTPFVQAGVDSLNLICDFTRGGWWHTVKDDMSRICPDSLAETGRVVLQLLSQLSSKN